MSNAKHYEWFFVNIFQRKVVKDIHCSVLKDQTFKQNRKHTKHLRQPRQGRRDAVRGRRFRHRSRLSGRRRSDDDLYCFAGSSADLPIRLPCYDFTPVIEPAFDSSFLSVRSLASGIPNSHGVTGLHQSHQDYLAH